MANGRKGFASMDVERRREVARRGGLAAQAKGVAHRWTQAEARIAGRKGGSARGHRGGVAPSMLGPVVFDDPPEW